MVEQIVGEPRESVFGTDSAAAEGAVDKGVTPHMKYLRKNQRVSLAALHDYVETCNVACTKIDGEVNISDIFTKALGPSRFADLRHHLGIRGEGEPVGQPSAIVLALLVGSPVGPGSSCGSGSAMAP
eukprot:3219949-Lingulodinium_polyedra.AAC.1